MLVYLAYAQGRSRLFRPNSRTFVRMRLVAVVALVEDEHREVRQVDAVLLDDAVEHVDEDLRRHHHDVGGEHVAGAAVGHVLRAADALHPVVEAHVVEELQRLLLHERHRRHEHCDLKAGFTSLRSWLCGEHPTGSLLL